MSEADLRAFIARPRGMEIGPLDAMLRRMNVTPDDPTMRVSAAAPAYDSVLAAIRASDFAVLIYDEHPQSLIYELGACDALRKPILIIVPPAAKLPLNLQRYMHVQVELAESEILESKLRLFVAEVRKGVKPRRTVKRSTGTKAKDPAVVELLRDLRRVRELRSAVELEHLTRRLLEEKGGFVETHSVPGERGADLALWSDAVKSVLPQPVLVEVKGGALSMSLLEQAEERLQVAVERSGAVAGLLLYLDDSAKRYESPERRYSNIWRADLEDFARELLRAPLALVLRRLSGAVANG